MLICMFWATLPLSAKTRVDIASENIPAVVTVNVLRHNGATFDASGFIVTPDGVIATARHVLDQAMYINVTFHTRAVSDQARVLAVSKDLDLALLKIPAKNLHTVTLADSDQARPGQEITVIGSPRRLQNSVSSGVISQIRQATNGLLLHQITAPISPSSSGSPVFNEQGHVISMAFSTYKGEGNQNLNFSIPSNYILQLLRQHHYEPAVATVTHKQPTLSYWQKVIRYWSGVKQRLWK